MVYIRSYFDKIHLAIGLVLLYSILYKSIASTRNKLQSSKEMPNLEINYVNQMVGNNLDKPKICVQLAAGHVTPNTPRLGWGDE